MLVYLLKFVLFIYFLFNILSSTHAYSSCTAFLQTLFFTALMIRKLYNFKFPLIIYKISLSWISSVLGVPSVFELHDHFVDFAEIFKTYLFYHLFI